jgi:hypothetical protein
MKKDQIAKEIYHKILGKFPGFAMSDLGSLLTLIDSRNNRTSKEFKKHIDEKVATIGSNIMKEHNFSIGILHLTIIIEALIELEGILFFRDQEKQSKDHYLESIQWNKLVNYIEKLPELNDIISRHIDHKLELAEIQFKFKSKKAIRIRGRVNMLEILEALQKKDHGLAGKVLGCPLGLLYDEGEAEYHILNVRRSKRDTAKALHYFFEEYTNMRAVKGKTSDKICRVIYDLMNQTGTLSEKDLGETDVEDFIRQLINRSDLEKERVIQN